MGLDSAALIKKLNKTCLNALQAAAGLCLSRTNPSVEVEHWLLKLAELPGADLARVFRQFEVDTSHLLRDLTRAIDQFRTGNARTPTLALSIDQLVREAWVLASVQYQATSIRSGVLLLALLDNDRLGRLARDASRELAKIPVETLSGALMKLVAGSEEDEGPAANRADGAPATAARPGGAAGQTPALDQYTINLTDRARKEQIDPVVGREAEVRQMVDILIRRRQNNPILTGEAGVGKTAVVEGFALRIAQGDVPEALRNVELRTLDLGLLQAGAGVKGEFENRLKQVIAEVKASPTPIILFIDEAHTMIGAGGQAGQGDAANLLKPALARGELRTIAATTWAEYKKYFEKDAALARRFQVIKVDEPAEDRAILMMRGITHMLEKHHGVRILDEAVEASVKLSHRYIIGRQLPDKSVSLLDTACARVAIGQNAVPPAIEDCRRQIDHLQVELGILERESATGARHDERMEEATRALKQAEGRLAELEKRWAEEKRQVEEIRNLSAQLEKLHHDRKAAAAGAPGNGSPAEPTPEVARLRGELDAKTTALRQLQGETPLMEVCVDAQTIAAVIAGWTGIPVGKMLADEIKTVLTLKTRLEERVIGQSDALEAISQRIRTSWASLTDPRRPVGVFLLVGPSGVGKTETALALADTLYGGERNLVVINMSEYQEKHTVSGLKGSPPGYIGYGEGGVLTEAVRRKPYCVLLLDEVEKAHPDVMELFFQVFDKGMLEDGEGREIDFKNAVILLTSNVGSDLVMKLCGDPDTMPTAAGLAEALRPPLLKAFPAALLGRMTTVPYYPISDSVMKQIVTLQLGRIAQRMKQNHKAQFSHSDDLVANIAGRCKEVESGARNVDHILTGSLLPEMSRQVLTRMAAGERISHVHVSIDDKGAFQYTIS
jgi:type VI secretion system protein VasG